MWSIGFTTLLLRRSGQEYAICLGGLRKSTGAAKNSHCDARGTMSAESAGKNAGRHFASRRLHATTLDESADFQPLTLIANGRFLREGK